MTERTTLVAVRREQVVGAALLTRFADDDRVSDSYRGGAEMRWLVCWPQHADAGDALAAACVATMDRWGAGTQWADGSLPAPSVYGIPDAWPHVRGVLERAGFEHGGRVEVVVAAAVADLPQAGPRRSTGSPCGAWSATTARRSSRCAATSRSASSSSART